MEKIDIEWLDPIHLEFEEHDTQADFLKSLRKTLRNGFRKQGRVDSELSRSVYVIRVFGDTVIDYPEKESPVLYIGRGNAPGRVISHIENWLSDIFYRGNDTDIEIRMLRPRRRGRTDYFKNIEADLIETFLSETGNLPFFNSRREKKYSGKIRYGPSQERQLRRLLRVGQGKRPQWAIRPMPANPSYETYWRGSR